MIARILRFAVPLLALCAGDVGAGEVRIITAPGLTPGPRFDGVPQRVAPPREEQPAAAIVDRRLGPVIVEDASRLLVRRFRIRLPGVAAVPLDETCRDDDGVDWPCGRRALAGLRTILRLTPIVCPLPADARSGSFEAECRLLSGGAVGAAFVASGWARAEAGGPWSEAEEKARRAARGIWGPAPAVTTAEPTTATAPSADIVLPPDVSTAPLPDGRDETTVPTRSVAAPDGDGAPVR